MVTWKTMTMIFLKQEEYSHHLKSTIYQRDKAEHEEEEGVAVKLALLLGAGPIQCLCKRVDYANTTTGPNVTRLAPKTKNKRKQPP